MKEFVCHEIKDSFHYVIKCQKLNDAGEKLLKNMSEMFVTFETKLMSLENNL